MLVFSTSEIAYEIADQLFSHTEKYRVALIPEDQIPKQELFYKIVQHINHFLNENKYECPFDYLTLAEIIAKHEAIRIQG